MSELSYFSIPSSAVGHTLNVLCCEPSGQQPRAVLQMTHGMAEHISRYEPLARWLADRGIAVIGHDHLGHGGTARSPEEYGFFALPDGNRTLLEDLYRVTKLAQDSWPGAPLFLLGHSMGSFYARQYLCERGGELKGAILLGSGQPSKGSVLSGRALCRALAAVRGWNWRSSLVEALAIGPYNAPFEPARTNCDWLNRDARQVDLYLADELCGFRFTLNGYYSMFTGILRLQDPELLARVPKDLPVLFLSGKADPVGNQGRGVLRAAKSLRDAGVEHVRVKLYPGARHELLMEKNHQQVFEDITRFIEGHLGR